MHENDRYFIDKKSLFAYHCKQGLNNAERM